MSTAPDLIGGTRTEYPEESDVRAWLLSADLTIPQIDLMAPMFRGACETSRTSFERGTGRRFKAETKTLLMAGPMNGRVLYALPEDLVSLSGAGIVLDGTTLVEDQDFDLVQDGVTSPHYSRVLFRGSWAYIPTRASHLGLSITGSWGYAATIPGDVWDAILSGAVLELIQQMRRVLVGDLVQTRQGSSEEVYATIRNGPLFPMRDELQARVKAARFAYRRDR